MFEHFSPLGEMFQLKLGAVLSMEYDSLVMLGEEWKPAMRSELREVFHGHAHGTRQQIENLRPYLVTLEEEEASQKSCPATKGLAAGSKLSR